jgi:hypothetical protein
MSCKTCRCAWTKPVASGQSRTTVDITRGTLRTDRHHTAKEPMAVLPPYPHVCLNPFDLLRFVAVPSHVSLRFRCWTGECCCSKCSCHRPTDLSAVSPKLSPSECFTENIRSCRDLVRPGEGVDAALERIVAQKAMYEHVAVVLAQRRQRIQDCEAMIAQLNAELSRLKGTLHVVALNVQRQPCCPGVCRQSCDIGVSFP